jgi:hypothetical protein
VEENAQLLELILSAVAGPASGVAVALLCMTGFGWFLIKYLLPQQERQLDKILKDAAEDRKLFEKSIGTVSRRLDKIEDDLSAIRLKI